MEQEKLFQFMIEHTLAMMLVFDAQGNVLYANPVAEKKLKYAKDLCQVSMIEIFPNKEELKESLNKSIEEMQQIMAYRGNRTCFPVNVRVVQYPGSYLGEQEVYLCIADDISEENFLQKKIGQAEEEVKEAGKVKTEFVANVTHELRTPVNGILGNAKALMTRETEPAKIKLLQLIERGCRDMNNLINNILDFSKLESGKFTLEFLRFNFRNMIDYVKNNHKNRMTEKGLDFSITVSENIPDCVIGDELRIVQILNNLISNAY